MSIQEEREQSPLLPEPKGEDDEESSIETLVPEERPLPKPVPAWKLIALTVSFLGVQFGWAIQIAYTTPIFLELGVGKFWVSFVWLAGPISGLLVQPIVGAISDKVTFRWGRRRPFILGGGIFIAVGMVLISNAQSIGEAFGDSKEHKNAAIVIAIIGFWILDLSNNTVQGPCRALLVDVAPPSQQNLGGALFSFMLGFGNLAGYYTGSLDLTKHLPFFKTNVRALFTIGMFVMTTCILITVTVVKEIPLPKTGEKFENPFIRILGGIKHMPKPMRRVCLVQFCSWLAWFTFLLYISGWVGENVFHGDPDQPEGSILREAFDEGVRVASFALSINAVITMVAALALPKLAICPGIRATYAIAQVILALCLLLTVFVKTKVGAIILIAGCGIPWAVVMVYPFTLVALSVDENESGLYMGVLNIFVVTPQILISLGIGFLLQEFKGNLAIPLATGGVFAVVSAFTVFFLIVDTSKLLKEIPTGAIGGH